MTDIEIGMSVIAKLYLHIIGNDLPTPFEAHKIKKIEDSELGTLLQYEEYAGANISPFIVTESMEEINEALEESAKYRDAGLNAIQSMLE